MSAVNHSNNLENIAPYNYDAFSLPENIDLTIYLGPHQFAADLPPGLGRILKKADVVIPEALGSIRETEEQMLEQLVENDSTVVHLIGRVATQSQNPLWKREFYHALRGSNSKVAVVDIEHTDPLLSKSNALAHYVIDAALQRDHDRVVMVTQQALPLRFDIQQQREQKILEQIGLRLPLKIADTTTPTRIAMFYGGQHAPLYDALAHKAQLEGNGSVITKDDRFAASTIELDVYSKFLSGEQISEVDAAQFALERLMTFEYQASPAFKAGKIPSKVPLNKIYSAIKPLGIDAITTAHTALLETLSSS